MIKRLLLFNTLLLTSFFAFSQNIAVEKFYADVTDQSARITDKKTDQNNKVCAIVKIETPLSLSDFSFDAGMIGIEHSEQRTGEVWVWLPSGAQRLTIIHKHLGAVRNYEFGEPLQAGMVYIMKLAGKVTTIVEDAITQQFLVVTCNIEGSTIEIKGYGREAFTNGLFSKLLPFGKYQYQVDAPKYQSSVGSFEITAAGKTQIKIDLIPHFSNVKISADGSIYINEVLKGENNWSGDLVKGSYKLEIKKPSHHTATKVFEVEANKDIVVQAPVPTPMYGKIQINSNVLGSIFIDGKDTKETAPVILDKILAGQHIIKLKADGYKPDSSRVTVEEGKIANVVINLEKGADFADGIEMVFVKGGTFMMGSNDGDRDENPVHSVTLSDFYIGKYEVTQAQWKAVMGNNPSNFKGDNLPVESVSWNDVQEFIRKLNAMTGKNYRLPTEAEWEFAARGGNSSRGYTYSGSNSIGNVAWYGGNADEKTHPVGTKQANELGIYDMSGNIWEWCSDCWIDDYYHDIGCSYRVDRGGSWLRDASSCRVAYRSHTLLVYRFDSIGFRLACSSK